MNDSQEPSYYEVALTNRQVLVFFVVLLVCVIGAFFSGVWLGQQRADEMPTVAEFESAPAPQGDEPLEELNFFTDDPPAVSSARDEAADQERQAAEPVASAGSPKTTLLEDLEGSSEESARKPTQKAEPRPAEPSRATSRPAVATAEAVAISPAATQSGFVIQVFSSADSGQARKLVDRLMAGGFQAFVSPVEVQDRTMYRVRIGPYGEKGEADSAAMRVKQTYQLDTWVTQQ